MAQLVKNPPAKPETWIRSLDLEDPLEKGKAILVFFFFFGGGAAILFRPQYSGLENGLYSPWGHKWSDTIEQLSLHVSIIIFFLQTNTVVLVCI